MPEILDFFKNRQDGDQQFRMAQLRLQVDQARSSQALALTQAQSQAALALTQAQTEGAQVVADAQSLDAAVKMQGQQTGVPWVDAVNATVRPFITYWWMILGFWFVDRAIRKNKGQ